jgi:hypothetical protein
MCGPKRGDGLTEIAVHSAAATYPDRRDRGRDDQRESRMDIQEAIAKAQDAITVRRVYGEPYERDGVTLIPAAEIRGRAGGGGGSDESKEASGSGGGYGVNARPVGAYGSREAAFGGSPRSTSPGSLCARWSPPPGWRSSCAECSTDSPRRSLRGVGRTGPLAASRSCPRPCFGPSPVHTHRSEAPMAEWSWVLLCARQAALTSPTAEDRLPIRVRRTCPRTSSSSGGASRR